MKTSFHYSQSIDWVEILSVLWNARKLIAYVVGSVTWKAFRCLIVGSEAVIYYGHARLTGDIDRTN